MLKEDKMISMSDHIQDQEKLIVKAQKEISTRNLIPNKREANKEDIRSFLEDNGYIKVVKTKKKDVE